jgi:hypothetical protein
VQIEEIDDEDEVDQQMTKHNAITLTKPDEIRNPENIYEITHLVDILIHDKTYIKMLDLQCNEEGTRLTKPQHLQSLWK